MGKYALEVVTPEQTLPSTDLRSFLFQHNAGREFCTLPSVPATHAQPAYIIDIVGARSSLNT